MGKEKDNNLDYGWRRNREKVLLIQDKSILLDDTAHLMQSAIAEMSNKFYNAERCMQCGICTGSCPYSEISEIEFSPRDFIQKTRLGLLDFASDDIWYCTGCGSCENKCPFDIKMTDVINDLRGIIYNQGAGFIPDSIRNTTVSMVTYKNPWKEDQAKRYAWVRDEPREKAPPRSDDRYLFHGCCFNSYDPHGLIMLKSTLSLLDMAGIRHEFLYESEVCCGDSVLRCGNETGFDILRNDTVRAANSTGLKKIINLSPHCYNTFKKWHFIDDSGYDIIPSVLMLHRIINEGLLPVKKRISKRVTFHDPCFLCKHNNIYREPRDIIAALCGDVVEMKHSGVNSLCCGGGGCGVWTDRKRGERLSDIRLAEAVSADAEIIVTACPICMNMLEGSIQSDPAFNGIEIKDIAELMLEAVL
jgi:Fe-S oxidoreductase